MSIEQTVKAAAQPKPVKVEAPKPKSIRYQTREKSANLFDVLVKGQSLKGTWDSARERCVWEVPSDLAPLFEKHTHVVTGMIVKV